MAGWRATIKLKLSSNLMLKQQRSQNWQRFQFHHVIFISGNHFVKPLIFVIDMVT